MNYYKRNIGDYAKKAGRLSMIEHGAYTLLMDACYDRERFPTLDDAIEWLWARDADEIAAIEFVLSRFFDLQDDGRYIQYRIQDELDAYHAMASTNQRIAREREDKRRAAKLANGNASTKRVDKARSVNEAPPNQEPLTTNQEPLTNNNKRIGDIDLNDSGASESDCDTASSNPYDDFEIFWDIYDYKKSKSQAQAKWKKLSKEKRVLAMNAVKAYVASTPNKEFRKHASTWLNNECWNDEITQSTSLALSNQAQTQYKGHGNENNQSAFKQSAADSYAATIDAQLRAESEQQYQQHWSNEYDVN